MIVDVYSFEDYRPLIRDLIRSRAQEGRGQRAALSSFIKCQPTFISHVLSGRHHFSLEQAEAACRFFTLDETATQYVLALVSYVRAGSQSLKAIYRGQLVAFREKATPVKTAVGHDAKISPEGRARYYSSWHCGAVHMLLTLKGFDQVYLIAERLKLSEAQALRTLEVLAEIGVITLEEGSYKVLTDHLHLDADAPEINSHHTSCRLKALDAMLAKDDKGLHFSAFLSCHDEDLPKLKETLLRCVQECSTLIKDSEPTTIAGLNLDFYRL